jgi:hypothetical protein
MMTEVKCGEVHMVVISRRPIKLQRTPVQSPTTILLTQQYKHCVKYINESLGNVDQFLGYLIQQFSISKNCSALSKTGRTVKRKGFGRRRSWHPSRYYYNSGIRLDRLMTIFKISVRIFSNHIKIQTEYLPGTNVQR